MKLAVSLVWYFVALVAPLEADAWDFDVHFHATYLVCRDLGMNHQFCAAAAACSEWTDQSLISGPFLLAKAREFNHFNGPYHDRTLEQSDVKGLVGWLTGGAGIAAWLRGRIMVSHPESPVPHALFMDALKQGDLVSALMHVHSIQDLDPHARFYSKVGHPTEGHWPDRYWLSSTMKDKFRESVRKTYRALFAVRQLLPPEALDLDPSGGAHGRLFNPSLGPEALENPDLLAETMLSDPRVVAIYGRDYLRDPEYVTAGLIWILQRLAEKGIVNNGVKYDQLIPEGIRIDGSTDLGGLITLILARGRFLKDNEGNEIFYMDRLMSNVFAEFDSFEAVENFYFDRELAAIAVQSGLESTAEEVRSVARESAKMAIANRITTFVTKGFVPTPIGQTDYVDMFEAEPLRKREMKIRQDAWNDLIEDLTGRRIAFSAMLLRNSGVVGAALRKLPLFRPELFNHRHIHDGERAGNVENISIPFSWRIGWVARQFRKILLKPAAAIHNAKFLNGALDYMVPDKFKELVAAGAVPTYDARTLNGLFADYDSVSNRLLRAAHSMVVRSGESLPPAPNEKSVRALTRDGALADCEGLLDEASVLDDRPT